MRFASCGVFLGLSLIVGVSPACLGAKPHAQERPRSAPSQTSTLPDFASLVSKVSAAVVHVNATHSLTADLPPDVAPSSVPPEDDSEDEEQAPSMRPQGDVTALGSGFRATDLPRLVAGTRPGASVRVEVWHKGETKDSTVVVEELS